MSDDNNVSTKKQDIHDDNQQEKLVPELRFPEFKDNWKLIRLKNLINNESSKLSINNLEDNYGNYPLYGASGFIKNINFYKKEENYIAIVKDGSGVGNSFIYNGKSSVVGTMQYLNTINNNDLKFAYYLLQTLNLEKYKIGSSIPHIYFKDYSKEKIYLPSINEQKEISNFLSLIDKKIELLEKKLVLWDKYIFSLKCKYFDNINVEKIVKFKEIIKKGKAGGTPKSSIQSYYNGEIPFLTINDMTKQGKFIKSTEKTITKEGLNNSSAWIVPKNSLLYSMYASIGFVSINKIDLTTSQAIYSIILKDNVNQEYIFHYLKNYKRFIHKYIETGTQGNLNSKIIKNIKIKLPSLEEQNYYSNLFNIFDYKIQTLNTKIKQYKTFKKYLLQNMFI